LSREAGEGGSDRRMPPPRGARHILSFSRLATRIEWEEEEGIHRVHIEILLQNTHTIFSGSVWKGPQRKTFTNTQKTQQKISPDSLCCILFFLPEMIETM
jgi:hypothetical protein